MSASVHGEAHGMNHGNPIGASSASDRIGIIGGTGPAGLALATRLALLGHPLLIGSRDPERAANAVAEIDRRLGEGVSPVLAVSNDDAAHCPVVVLAVNAGHTLDTARSLAGSLDGAIVVTMASTIRKAARGFTFDDTRTGSIAARLQAAVPQARVVAGFHHLPAASLGDPAVRLAADVVLCGDDEAAVATVIERFDGLVDGRLIDGGVLANAQALELLTPVLITLNARERAAYAIQFVDAARRDPAG